MTISELILILLITIPYQLLSKLLKTLHIINSDGNGNNNNNNNNNNNDNNNNLRH